MHIYLPLFRNTLKAKVFDLLDEKNPGVGGTQHVAILLGARLAKAMPDWSIYLVDTNHITLDSCPNNLEVLKFYNFTGFCEHLARCDSQNTRAIIPASLLKSLSIALLHSIANVTYCWIHHPFLFVRSLKKASFLAYVCVGEYQNRSINAYYPNTYMIQNIFPVSSCNIADAGECINKLPTSQFPLRLVHLGALVPGKGFLYIAKQWKNIKTQFPNVIFHVIGSSSTYSSSSDVNALIPTSNDFADKILKYIPADDIVRRSVIFHGNMGADKVEVISNSHFAIQNPTGFSEAFPASPIECMALGTPVIASSDYGMNDAMSFFDELTIKHPSDICQLIVNALDSPNRYRGLALRSIAVASFFSCKSDESVEKWLELILHGKIHSSNIRSSGFLARRALCEWIIIIYRRAKCSLKSSINSF